ncbi:hypothetical protein Pint_27905 [Pistacia integerrima]|uniref:Uncharacterized protein n=1 Tax=Pistacia integerrima TaxID=434235 RepID=A0ACC0YNC2_9ROSI|nr:hypothetical protein Pint_27905 [Pistacia integerrima]
MKAHHLSLFLFLSLSISCLSQTITTTIVRSSIQRRILHQPLFPAGSAPPPGAESPPPPAQTAPPPPGSSTFPNPDQPFFPEVPAGQSQDQNQPPPATTSSSTNGSIPIPAATQPTKPAKKVAIAISVGIVTLGMLSALAFFLYRHRSKHPGESQKLVGPNSQRVQDDARVPPSSFLYIGTVEPSRTSVSETANGSPYHKLNSIKRSDRYRPSPELQPLPQLTRPPSQNENSPTAMSSSSDEESRDTAFYTPQGSSISNEDYYTPVVNSTRPLHLNNNTSVPHSKRTSPKSRLAVASPELKQVIIPSIKQQPPPPPPPPPPTLSHMPERLPRQPTSIPYSPKRPKFSAPPPPPNMELLRSLNSNSSSQTTKIPVPPPPPPPPPTTAPRNVGSLDRTFYSTPTPVLPKQQSWTPSHKSSSGSAMSKTPVEEVNRSVSTAERTEGDSTDGAKPKLKALHWDKVRATSDRATVWDQLKSSSFQLNEDMMETLFGCNSVNSVPKEATRKSVLPPVEQENRVLDPKKSQNIAILLRALNVTRDEVSEALLDGNPESLGAELLETLVKMAPTKEEEIKLREYSGDISKLGTAERFLKTVLDIPFAFKRVEAMLYRANFDTEVKYLRKSYQTLEAASEELKNSRLFLKLLEAVLKTGNRMNVGTNRGDAKAFKLDTLLKLVDIKGADGKTTLLHFVVQEIIRSEGAGTNSANENAENKNSSTREDDFKKQGLQVVAGLSRDLGNVKKAAGMDSEVLSGYVKKLEMGLEKVRLVLQYEKSDMQGKFFNSMKMFLKEAEEEISWMKADERKALLHVKEVTEYFHGDTAKEEAHPFRIFMIVRDFLSILDHVCKEVGRMQERTMVGSARSFRISSTASLPVLNRYNVRQYSSSDEESSSP